MVILTDSYPVDMSVSPKGDSEFIAAQDAHGASQHCRIVNTLHTLPARIFFECYAPGMYETIHFVIGTCTYTYV